MYILPPEVPIKTVQSTKVRLKNISLSVFPTHLQPKESVPILNF